jgi:electron transport complex protein RnfG
METKSNAFKDFIIPVLVLVAICFAVTFALAFTYGITSPIIAENTAKAASEARKELIPGADNFSEADVKPYTLEEGKVYVLETYTADNGAGMVVTVITNSYGGSLTAMVGIDKGGAITGVKVTDHADTPGVGTKAQEESHLTQYRGLTELLSNDVKTDSSINAVTGASVSSGAIHKAVYCALEQYKEMGGVK